MSLTNPNTPISQQDLQDFYHKILPYMRGGMPEVLANKFSKGDMYSTDEKMIGQWIDGKPLYQKVVTCKLPSSAGSTQTILTLDSNCVIQYYWGHCAESSVTLNSYYTSSWYIASGIKSNKYQIEAETKGYVNKTAYIILQYTKTTDSPISIGNDTDYSTEEKIVGTWIDGKPIYQKVFPTTATMGSSFTIMIPNTTEYNIAGIVKCEGIRYYPVGTTATECVPMLAYIDVNASAKPVYCYMYGAAAQFNYIILQYTKITD